MKSLRSLWTNKLVARISRWNINIKEYIKQTKVELKLKDKSRSSYQTNPLSWTEVTKDKTIILKELKFLGNATPPSTCWTSETTWRPGSLRFPRGENSLWLRSFWRAQSRRFRPHNAVFEERTRSEYPDASLSWWGIKELRSLTYLLNAVLI